MRNPFRYFNRSREIIRLTEMLYIRYPVSLRQVEYILFERGIDLCHETVRLVDIPHYRNMDHRTNAGCGRP